MISRNRPPAHPGGILKRHYLQPLSLPVSQAAADLGVSRKTVSKIVNERGDVTPEMALRLSRTFRTSPELWLNLQHNYDLWHATRRAKSWRSARVARPEPPPKEARESRVYHDLDRFYGSWVHDAETEAALEDQHSGVDAVRRPADPRAVTANFTAVYQKRGKRYIGFVEEILGVKAHGKSLAKVKRNLKETLALVLQSNRDLAHRAHPKSAIEEPISVTLA